MEYNQDVIDLAEPSVIERLNKDVKDAAKLLTDIEARYYCDLYLASQKARVRANNQVKALDKLGEPNRAITWVRTQNAALESRINKLLEIYAKTRPASAWALSLVGVGPVIAAGCAAHIQVQWIDRETKELRSRDNLGKLWAFAGFSPDPRHKWKSKTKRPYNQRLKTLMFYFGDCQVKFQNHERSPYGELYRMRRAYDDGRNERGELADQAAETLRTKDIGKDTEAYKYYKEGLLPPARMLLRTQRWLAKIYLSHYWALAYRYHYLAKDGVDRKPAQPWVIEFGGHTDRIAIPNDPFSGDW